MTADAPSMPCCLPSRRDVVRSSRALAGAIGNDGDDGEDVNEDYFYLDATPPGSNLKAPYKYPQSEYRCSGLVEENTTALRNVLRTLDLLV